MPTATFMQTKLFLVSAAFALSVTASAVAQSIDSASDRDSLSTNRSRAASVAVDSAMQNRTVLAAPLDGRIDVDGILDEEAWQSAIPISQFVQRDPTEGAQPSEHTEVRIVYDESAIYFGARMLDSAPDSIVARLGRRDAELEGDLFMVFLDPYKDGRSGYYFGVNPAGTLFDGVLYNDDWDDSDWDGVWMAAAAIDAEGWTAEIRIPYSQLRFHRQSSYVWGVNFKREISRKNERDFLVYSPRNESGFVSRFWDLTGISAIKPRRQLEIIPYVTSKASYDQTVSGNPFNDGSTYGIDAGADVRYGLTPNLTLNGTINPDFGQVEVDPAVINLSDFETYYPEKRPFFIEGSSIFNNFGYGGANSNWGFNWGNPEFFYSRRIGRAPHGSLPDNDHSDVPDGTRILGATKVTGKLGRSWNTGTVHAVTGRTHTDIRFDGTDSEALVEPAAYYGVFRAQKEFAEGRQGLGFISTTANRFLSDTRLEDEMNRSAYTVGVDGWTFLDREKTYVISGWAGGSHVRGSTRQMVQLQESSLHYFQRPDAGHVRIDSQATSMTGWGGRVALNKQRGPVILNSALGVISPSFDVNDLGFQFRTDVINGHIAAGYQWPNPGRFTRNARLTGAVFGSKDFGGTTIWSGVFALADVQLLNYYELGARFAANPQTVSNTRTRGGPQTLNPPGWEAGFFASTDRRRSVVLAVDAFSYRSDWTRDFYAGLSIEWKPAANFSLNLSPSAEWNYEHSQWVNVYEDPHAVHTFGQRYVFGEMDQFTLSSSVRANWTFTPQLSFQLYAQPLFSTGNYENFKELARTRSYDFNIYGEGASTYDPVTGKADPDGPGPAAPIEIPTLDFNVASLRGTAVLRWEYRPGSTFYLVWTQRRSEETEDPHFRLRSSADQLIRAPMENILLVKLTYWFSP